jgi:hypothetical protein
MTRKRQAIEAKISAAHDAGIDITAAIDALDALDGECDLEAEEDCCGAHDDCGSGLDAPSLHSHNVEMTEDDEPRRPGHTDDQTEWASTGFNNVKS